MKIRKITIHNFRSVQDITFCLDNYSLLVGENNAGKTTIINAIRTFYGSLTFSEDRDFPKFKTNDSDCWVEVTFVTSADEQETLKEEYKSTDNLLKLRRYLKHKDYKGNLYAYENGVLTHTNQFYGSTNIGLGKLGKIIYIPALSKTDDGLKMSGPSPLRDMVNFVFEKVVEQSQSYKNLNTAFEVFNKAVSTEETNDGFSLSNLTDDINEEIGQFGLGIGLGINTIKPNDIVKTLISHSFKDNNLNSRIDDVSSLGQGVQRHLIYTLIKLSAKYTEKKKEKKKDFTPDFTIILFEEPEAFLHPSQQEQLNISLKKLSKNEEQQVLITTHSTTFVSKNILEIKNITKINKENGIAKAYQLTEPILDNILNQNVGLYTHFCNQLSDTTYPQNLRKKVLERKLGDEIPNISKKLSEESLKYFLWLDSERASMFFSKHVIICEGASEKIFLDYLINEEWHELKKNHIYFLDALGKYNIHRFVKLLGELGIKHSILMDSDEDKDIHKEINTFISSHTNGFTHKIHSFEIDFENYLGISKPSRDDLKPLNVIKHMKENLILTSKIESLKSIIDTLIT